MSGRYSFAVQAGSTTWPILRRPSAMSGGTWAPAVPAMARGAPIAKPKTKPFTLTVITPPVNCDASEALRRLRLTRCRLPLLRAVGFLLEVRAGDELLRQVFWVRDAGRYDRALVY